MLMGGLLAQLNYNRRQDVRRAMSLFVKLMDTPGSLATGVKLPAGADLHVSTSSLLAVSTTLVTTGGRDLGVKAGAANKTHAIGWLAADATVTKRVGAPGVVTLYVEDAFGALHKIAEG